MNGESHTFSPDETGTVTGTPTSQLLLRAPRAAALLSTSVRTWRTLDATGKIPRAIRLGCSTYWRPEELKAWVAAGCPDRVTWEAMQQL